MAELKTIIARQNRVQLRRPSDDISSLASLNAVLKSQNKFSSQFSTSTRGFKCCVVLKLNYTVEDEDGH
jgi:hypothetical protein